MSVNVKFFSKLKSNIVSPFREITNLKLDLNLTGKFRITPPLFDLMIGYVYSVKKKKFSSNI